MRGLYVAEQGLRRFAALVLLLVCVACQGRPVERADVSGEILDQRVNAKGGYTVLRVWGTHREMGQALGTLMGSAIARGVDELRQTAGEHWPAIRQRVQDYRWVDQAVLEEFEGLLAGVRAAVPNSRVDLIDLQVLNTYGDWSDTGPRCRSTSCWGRLVAPPFRTITTRRLDYGLPGPVMTQFHMVVCAFAPSDGSPQWVNIGWPGYVCSVTGINEYGTLASLHDWPPQAAGEVPPNPLPRSMACRLALTDVEPNSPTRHLEHVFALLRLHPCATAGLLNVLSVGGGGTIKHTRGQGYFDVRRPLPEYMGGEAQICANDDVIGDQGADTWLEFYASLAPERGVLASVEGQWDAAYDTKNLHIVSVGVRGHGDMVIWAEGKTASGRTRRLSLEWADLFSAAQ